MSDNKTSRKDLFICFLVTTVTFMELLDATILNTAVPKIAQSLSIDVLNLKTAITVYLISLAIFLPISGWIAEKIGTRNTIVSATLLFTVSSLFCGFSSNLTELVIARIFQGMGASLMTPVCRLIIVNTISKENLQDAAGLVSIPITFGPLLGPLLGGFIVTNYHWSWIFFINVPVGIMASILMWSFLPNQKSSSVPPFDWKGFILAGTGLALLNFAVENSENPFFTSLMLALMIGAGIISLSCLMFYLRRAVNPVIDLNLFRYGTFRHGIILTVLGFITTGAIPLILCILFQNLFGLSPLASGLISFSAALGSVFIKPHIGRLVNKFTYKTLLLAYPVIMTLAIFFFTCVTHTTPRLVICTVLFIYGMAFSIHMNMMNVIPFLELGNTTENARATSLVSTVQQFCLSLGVSLGILILDTVLDRNGIKEVKNVIDPVLGLKSFHITFVIIGILSVALILLNSRFNYKPSKDFKVSSMSH